MYGSAAASSSPAEAERRSLVSSSSETLIRRRIRTPTDAAPPRMRFVLRRPVPERQTIADLVARPIWWAVGSRPGTTGNAGDGSPMSLGPPGDLHPEPRFGLPLVLSAIASLVLSSRFGSESLVRAAGPLPALLGCLLLPVVWFVPTTLVVAELATAIRSNAGPQMWANVGLGTLWAYTSAMLSFIINVLVLAAGSAIFADYVKMALPSPSSMTVPWELATRVAVLVGTALLNCVSVAGVSGVLNVVAVLSILPFLVMPVWQFSKAAALGGGANWVSMGRVAQSVAAGGSGANVPLFMAFLSFTHEGVENVGAIVEETVHPAKTLKRAIVPATLLSYLVYLLPFMAGISAFGNRGLDRTGDYRAWTSGYWAQLCLWIGGSWFQQVMLWSGIAGRLGASLSMGAAGGRMAAGMGTLDLLPRRVSDALAQYHPWSKAPATAIALLTVIALPVALVFQSDELLALSQVFIGARMLLIYASFFSLRLQYPTLRRRLRYPAATLRWSIATLAPSMIFTLAVVGAASFLNFAVFVTSSATIVVIICVSALCAKYARPRGLYGTVEAVERTSSGAASGPDWLRVEATGVRAQDAEEGRQAVAAADGSESDDDDDDGAVAATAVGPPSSSRRGGYTGQEDDGEELSEAGGARGRPLGASTIRYT